MTVDHGLRVGASGECSHRDTVEHLVYLLSFGIRTQACDFMFMSC